MYASKLGKGITPCHFQVHSFPPTSPTAIFSSMPSFAANLHKIATFFLSNQPEREVEVDGQPLLDGLNDGEGDDLQGDVDRPGDPLLRVPWGDGLGVAVVQGQDIAVLLVLAVVAVLVEIGREKKVTIFLKKIMQIYKSAEQTFFYKKSLKNK